MKKQTIIQYCHEKDCTEYRKVAWSGQTMGKWYCRKHAFRYLEQTPAKEVAALMEKKRLLRMKKNENL